MCQQQFNFQIPDGTKIKQIIDLKDEIAFYLGVDYVDIRKNGDPRNFTLELGRGNSNRTLFEALSDSPEGVDDKLLINPGFDNKGDDFTLDLIQAPHLLIGGTTSSGKSSLLHNLIISLISRYHSGHVKLAMIDPKQVELSLYKDIPHLFGNISYQMDDIMSLLGQMIDMMEQRYSLLVSHGFRNLSEYNQDETVQKIPYQIIVIDEYADLIYQNKKIENLVARLAQKGRAAGLHLIIATQRPSADIITPVLKANIPVRVALKVASMENSRVIIGKSGAENLTGKGEMLITGTREGIKRLHGYYISETDLQDVRAYYQV